MKKELLEKIINGHKNLIVEGEISSGKTSNVLLPLVEDIIEKKESLFLLDCKEEYINRYYEKLKASNYNIIIINLRDMNKSEGWNPLQYPYELYKKGNSDKALEYLEKIGKTLFRTEPSADPFWTYTASDFFKGVVLGLFKDAKESEINLNSVNAIFNGTNKKVIKNDYLTEYFRLKESTDQSFICASSTIMAPQETKGSILSVARQPINVMLSRISLANLMSKTTFSFEDIASKPTAIFFIARDDSDYLSILPEMFIEQLYAILLDLKPKFKFHFVLDNFDIMKGCNDLVNILSSCLSRNIRLYLSTRSFSTLENKYSDYLSKLSDIVTIQNNSVELTIGNDTKTLEVDFENIPFVEGNIEYPTLNVEKVDVFDLISFVDSHLNITSNPNPNNENGKVDIDELTRRIDSKMAELEEEEEQRKQKKSVLEQFKV